MTKIYFLIAVLMVAPSAYAVMDSDREDEGENKPTPSANIKEPENFLVKFKKEMPPTILIGEQEKYYEENEKKSVPSTQTSSGNLK